jgi:hypothetical protein
MSTAQKLLLIYGVVVLVYSFLLGFAMAKARSTAPAAPRALTNTHLSGLMQAPLHLSLAAALAATGFTGGAATTGAVLLIAGCAMEQIGATLNWLQHTNDQFAQRSLGFKFNAAGGPLMLVGAVILAIGIITNLG